jgi:hypothetical protein
VDLLLLLKTCGLQILSKTCGFESVKSSRINVEEKNERGYVNERTSLLVGTAAAGLCLQQNDARSHNNINFVGWGNA